MSVQVPCRDGIPTHRGVGGPGAGVGPFWYHLRTMRFVLAMLAFALACVPGATRAFQPSQPPPLVVLLASDQLTYRVGTPVTFTLAIDNAGAASVPTTLPSGQRYEIVVLAGDVEVWRWSANRAFPAVIMEPEFAPGVTLLGRETWDWRDNAGNPLPPGTYRVVGSLATNPPRIGNPVEVTLALP